MNLHDNCACCGMSRRDFLKLSALFTSSFGAAIAADNWNLPVNANANDQPVKIGYTLDVHNLRFIKLLKS